MDACLNCSSSFQEQTCRQLHMQAWHAVASLSSLRCSAVLWLLVLHLLVLLLQEDGIAGQLPPPAEGFQQPNQMNDPYAQATRSSFLPPAADRQMPPWGMQQQQQQQPGLDAGASRWGLPPGAEQQPYGSYFGQQQQPVRQPQGAFAGYEDPLMQQQRLQQQQYGSLPPGMMGDAGFGGSSSGVSGSAYPGQQQYPGQLPQQQQQPFGMPADYQDPAWYAGNTAAGYDQPPFGAAAGSYPGGAAGSFTPDAAAAAAGVGQYGLPGAAAAAGYPPLDGSALLPLPPAAGEQQQQQQRGGQQQQPQQQQPGGRPAYERVDDWE
jgi:hypothetical protein